MIGWIALTLTSCNEDPSDAPGTSLEGPADAAQTCSGDDPGERLLRRLTHDEYDRTLADLFGVDLGLGRTFAADPVVDGFRNDAHALTVGDLLSDQYRSAAEAAAEAVAVGELLPCDPAVDGDEACAAAFVEDFGFRAFRRPLTEDDVGRYHGLWTAVASEDGFDEGIRWVVIAMLQSPHFLYRSELGVQIAPGLFTLTGWERASALSYTMWGTMPDDALMDAAAAGRLDDVDGIVDEVARMTDDPRTLEGAADFVVAWLDLDQLDTVSREGLTPDLRTQMRDETEALVMDLAGEGATLADLMTSRHTFIDPALADHYDLPASGEVTLDGDRYGGLLTQGSVLTTWARPSGSSPVHRGILVREHLLCQPLPPPPSNLDTSPPEVDPTLSTRDRYAEHASNPECAVCHDLIDPLGFAFEHYDQLGRWRSDDAGHVVDDSGWLGNEGTSFVGPFELSTVLIDHPQFRSCFVETWRRHARGTDACGDDLGPDVGLLDPLVAVPTTYGFLNRSAPGAEGDSLAIGDRSDPETPDGTVAPPPDDGVTVTVTINDDWGAGYCADGVVQNDSDAPVVWSGRWPQDGAIVNIWNAVYAEDGIDWTFRGADFNAEVGPGEVAGFGFCADR